MYQGRHIASRGVAATTVLCVLVGTLAAGCRHQGTTTQIQTLRVAVPPTELPEALRNRHGPLIEYLQRELGLSAELVIPADSDELLAMFHGGTIDMAYLGGYSYVLAHERDGAVPLVMRDIDLGFTSVFLVRPDSRAQRLEDLKGARFSFGARLSASGHLMPRLFLRERGIDPEQFFKETLYSGGHDTTAYWVRDGKVDVGVASADTVRKMLRNGSLVRTDVRLLWETPSYPNEVWAVRPDLPPRLIAQIQDTLLALSSDTPEQGRVLAAAGAGSFLPALDEDFRTLRQATAALDDREGVQ